MRTINFLDKLLCEVDGALRTILPPQQRSSTRASPAQYIEDTKLSQKEKKHISGLMRVNHSGEVCAQGLYQGQALTAKLTHIKQKMANAAAEEVDHLAWCEIRLAELNSHPSRLNPLWYAGSLCLGALAGLAGDKVSLGFVVETERQVSSHLQKHIHNLPQHDNKSKAILKQMQEDEEHHATVALEAGGIELPNIIKLVMSVVSKFMTRSSYYI